MKLFIVNSLVLVLFGVVAVRGEGACNQEAMRKCMQATQEEPKDKSPQAMCKKMQEFDDCYKKNGEGCMDVISDEMKAGLKQVVDGYKKMRKQIKCDALDKVKGMMGTCNMEKMTKCLGISEGPGTEETPRAMCQRIKAFLDCYKKNGKGCTADLKAGLKQSVNQFKDLMKEKDCEKVLVYGNVPAEKLCDLKKCSEVIMNNNLRDCRPGKELDKCIKDKVLGDPACKGDKRQATEDWLEEHVLDEEAHCGAEDLKKGCAFTDCSTSGEVVQILAPGHCKKGREFTDCLKEKVLTADTCEGEKKAHTEKGIKRLYITEESKCAAKAVYAGCVFAKQCGDLVEASNSKKCEDSKKFIECLQTQVVPLENNTDCGEAERASTNEGIKGLEAHYLKYCVGDSATNAVVSLVALLAGLIAASLLNH